MSLARTSLSISENSTVVALKHILNNGRGGIGVDFFLCGPVVVTHIKGELLGSFVCEWFLDENLATLGCLNDTGVTILDFSVVDGPASDADADSLIAVRKFDILILAHFKL